LNGEKNLGRTQAQLGASSLANEGTVITRVLEKLDYYIIRETDISVDAILLLMYQTTSGFTGRVPSSG